MALINLEEYKFEKIERFVYLDVMKKERGKSRPGCKNGVKGNKKLENLNFQIKPKYISKEWNLRSYKMLIRPTVVYASKT